jgi:uncharacterized protein (TIGR02466 family)
MEQSLPNGVKLNIERLFPTSVYVFDNVLEPEYIDSMLEHIKKSAKINKEKRRGNWQSESFPKLYQHPKYKELGNKVLELGKHYLNDLKYEYDDLVLNDMWSNILKPGEFHTPHTHSNNFVSGVFYLQTTENSPAIQFLDPRGQTCVIMPNQKELTKYNSTRYFFPGLINRMVLFPSWLQHYVPINESNQDRVSVAFNMMLKGKVGRPENFQSNIF